MGTYVKDTSTGQIGKLQESPAAVKKMIATGTLMGVEVIKATAKLRADAARNILVKNFRVLSDGRVGYL